MRCSIDTDLLVSINLISIFLIGRADVRHRLPIIRVRPAILVAMTTTILLIRIVDAVVLKIIHVGAFVAFRWWWPLTRKRLAWSTPSSRTHCQ